MHILWSYLKHQKWVVAFALLLAGISTLLGLTDPIIFGKIIDDYAANVDTMPQGELVNGVLYWLAIAILVALASRIAKAFQEYYTRKAVQHFGMQIFNDGLKADPPVVLSGV
ncbi:MAG: hypothetical protein WKF87_17465 [Chryseolinea sp.]